MELEKGDSLGVIFEGNKLHGLWFSNIGDTKNIPQIQMVIALQEASHGRKTSIEDYIAATSGLCEIKPGPPQIGGFIMLFPSVTGK